jgi:hypothetical protein
MWRFFYIMLAVLLIGVGLIMFPLPIPLGAPMIAVGVVILISHSRGAARFMTYLRVAYPVFNRTIQTLEMKAPKSVARSLRRTRPEILRYFGRSRKPASSV